MKKNLLFKVLVIVLLVAFTAVVATGCSGAKTTGNQGTVEKKASDRVYYMISSHQAHPYFADSHLALRYAAEYFKVKIIAAGPDGWDTKAQAEAIEQAIAKKPSGIITRLWDAAPQQAVKDAMAAGIPVICTETTIPDSGALCYIGLDNYQCGRDTAAELVKRAGNSGKVALMGNWGASNTDAKQKGVIDYLTENASGWQIVTKADDKAATNDAIEAAKSIFNNFPDVNAILGLDSSSGSGIALAMQELNIPAGKIHAVVHDREVATLEYIKKGFIDATLINKTATDEYLAILLMQDWNDGGLKNIPISGDNAKAGIDPLPEHMYNTVAVIDAKNVDLFMASGMPVIKTDLYNH
jgi:ribose transport system substrate-binding protein